MIQTAETIKDEDRKTEAEIEEKMKIEAPMVIRAMLDIKVKAISLYDRVKLQKNNRMADFTRWGCAITQALGIDHKYFEKAYQKNIETQNEEAIKTNPVAEWLINWYDYNNFQNGYSGSASDLLEDITRFADEVYNRDLNWVDGWPRGATPFGKKLTEAMPNLKEYGYDITYVKGRGRKYKIRKIIDDPNDNTAGQRSLDIVIPKDEELTKEALKKILSFSCEEPLSNNEKESIILPLVNENYGKHKEKIIEESTLRGLSVEESEETIKRLEAKRLICTPTRPDFYFKVREAGSL